MLILLDALKISHESFLIILKHCDSHLITAIMKIIC